MGFLLALPDFLSTGLFKKMLPVSTVDDNVVCTTPRVDSIQIPFHFTVHEQPCTTVYIANFFERTNNFRFYSLYLYVYIETQVFKFNSGSGSGLLVPKLAKRYGRNKLGKSYGSTMAEVQFST